MLTAIKNWMNPPIRQYSITDCPSCARSIREEMTRRQQSNCVFTTDSRPHTQIFWCGRCNGKSEWHGEPGEKQLVFKRVLRPLNPAIYRDLIQLAEDAQSQYNIALLTSGMRGVKPDETDFSKLDRKAVAHKTKQLRRRTRNFKG
jgi:hypothetical protein